MCLSRWLLQRHHRCCHQQALHRRPCHPSLQISYRPQFGRILNVYQHRPGESSILGTRDAKGPCNAPLPPLAGAKGRASGPIQPPCKSQDGGGRGRVMIAMQMRVRAAQKQGRCDRAGGRHGTAASTLQVILQEAGRSLKGKPPVHRRALRVGQGSGSGSGAARMHPPMARQGIDACESICAPSRMTCPRLRQGGAPQREAGSTPPVPARRTQPPQVRRGCETLALQTASGQLKGRQQAAAAAIAAAQDALPCTRVRRFYPKMLCVVIGFARANPCPLDHSMATPRAPTG